ncbi:glycosyltransferase [Ramlibacter sp. 2FC]|uniref:glycosyltransferase n=1 Tax=Ramlibacter sp. 2FC TaxID=2502188 RepID=UPI001BB1E94E|nr:glycosyltransferase [Ramlibacter sp. 2FC]
MNDMLTPSLVVVTPVYEDVEASSRLFKELNKALGPDVYIVAVDDGSVRQPVDLASLHAAGLHGVVIRLKRNVGHQRAIAIGLNYVADHLPDAARVVVMDSDGEDLPETIKELIAPLKQPDIDVVVAQRKSRVETLRFRAFYVVYKWLFKLLTGRKISFGNFMALKPAAVKRLAAMQELWIHVAGCALTSKLRMATCPLDRGPRYAGQSKMNFVGLALHGFKGLMVFAEDVLVRVGIACAIVAMLSVAGSVAAVGLKLLGFATPGWFSVALGILLLVFLQTGALTLMTLMLTGVVRGGAVTTVAYRDFVDTVLHARPVVSA